MVTQKQAKRKRDIKTKLMAAICMLLVSSIMMVSTTYAWFTLSTAPEVTGINTAVGANGNLEMALVPLNGDLSEIESGAGDSLESWTTKNTTWGNLVDLSDESYGLQQITLYPSALSTAGTDADGNTLLNTSSLLKTPTYGADGRVADLLNNTSTSTYGVDSNGDTASGFPTNSFYGVRAVGVASGMTPRQLAYRNAVSAANTATGQAKTKASTSLNQNGNVLANVAAKKATDDKATYTQEDVSAMMNIVNDLLGTTGNTGSLQYIEQAYMQYILALAASKEYGSDAAYQAVESAVNAADATLTSVTTVLTNNSVTLPEALSNAITKLNATKTTVTTAQSELEELQSQTEAITWEQISTPLNRLANTSAMTINGIAISAIKEQENLNKLISDVTAQKGITVVMTTNGGVYADIADHCGNYGASIQLSGIEYGGLVLNTSARMEAQTTEVKSYLSVASTAVSEAGAPEKDNAANAMPMTDMYGYILDLAFRTNAADSNLLLQIDPADRIYAEQENGALTEAGESTLGAGSSMSFTSTTTDFTAVQMAELMKAIRIVFFNKQSDGEVETITVLANAKLDMDYEADAEGKITSSDFELVGGNTITAKMYLYKQTVAGEEYYEEATAEELADANTQKYTKVEGQYSQYTGNATELDSETTYYTTSDSDATYQPVEKSTVEQMKNDGTMGDTTLYTKAEDTYTDIAHDSLDEDVTYYCKHTSVGEEVIDKNNSVITALTQNTATAVSVLVYLDGEEITNADVAATAATSMTGTMNLQFASSANLVPMEYAGLMNTTGAAATEEFTVNKAEGITGADKATKGVAYTFKYTGTQTVSVSVGTTPITTPVPNEDGVYTIPADQVTGNIVISLTNPLAG